uniref:3-oxo-5-alpha-steroid 4-dehydrogenase C-terminal domain-containing protein n=1 Tax=Araucaria cunninghamii TaxID=56994 RepID=A0A0D6QRC3_ARACU
MASQILFENPPSPYIRGLEVIVTVGGLAMGLMEFMGVHLKYSKFNVGSSSSAQLPSRMGMFIFYAPAFLVAAFFLFCKLEWERASFLLEKMGLLQLCIRLQLLEKAGPRFLVLSLAVALHFLKRLIEVLFVHRYSGGIAIDTTIITTSLYALYSANVLYAMQISEGLRPPSIDLMPLGIFLFIVGMSGNLYHHHLLSTLRKEGEKGYQIPHGGLFDLVVCPHYFFEVIDFVGMAFISQIPVAFCAAFMVFCYLLGRSLSTKSWYLKKFESFPSNRKALIPFLI